jgi:hypothetical protein
LPQSLTDIKLAPKFAWDAFNVWLYYADAPEFREILRPQYISLTVPHFWPCLQAIKRVNGKRMIWNEFAEAMRVLTQAVDRDVLEHLQQLEKDPDSMLSIHWWNYIRTLRTTNYNVYWTICFIGDLKTRSSQ